MSLQPIDSNLFQTGRNVMAGNYSDEYTPIDILMEQCRTELENYFTIQLAGDSSVQALRFT